MSRGGQRWRPTGLDRLARTAGPRTLACVVDDHIDRVASLVRLRWRGRRVSLHRAPAEILSEHGRTSSWNALSDIGSAGPPAFWYLRVMAPAQPGGPWIGDCHQIPCKFNGQWTGYPWNREAKGAGRPPGPMS